MKRVGKRRIVKNIVKNITYNNNTINKYYAPQPGPSPAPEAQPERAPNLFPSGEREVRAYSSARNGTYRRVQSVYTGELRGDCGNCSAPSRDIAAFAPEACHNNLRKRPEFFAALDAYKAAYDAGDLEGAREARATIAALRPILCPPCRARNKNLSPMEKVCRDCLIELRQAACDRGGCMNPGCCETGPNAWQVLEGDHINPADKVRILSEWRWWACNGGPAAMRREADKCQWLCRFCHSLEPTSKQGDRLGDPATLPNGKYNGTEEEKTQYRAKHHAKIVYPKQCYVDAEKLRRGVCLACQRRVTPANVVAFHFHHRDETTKMKGEGTLAGKQGGVAGLVNNHAKRTALAKIKPILDNEMTLCDVLCANCHKRETYDYENEEDTDVHQNSPVV